MAKKKKSCDKVSCMWALLRISLGTVFLWAFVDKTFGLGLATVAEDAWLAGGSPTLGFLSFATMGPFASFYQSLAGNVVVDWLFMVGLLLIGLSLLLGIGVKVAGYSGALMLFLMWTAVLPPEHHPFMDDHLIYGMVMIALPWVSAGRKWGLGSWWEKQKLVKKYPFLA